MKKILKSYKSTLILLTCVIIGSVCGIIFKEDAAVVKPLGDLFLNLLLVIIIPLIFFTVTSSIAKMYQPKRLSKILISTIVVFLVSSVIAVLVSFVATSVTDLVKDSDTEAIREVFSDTGAEEEDYRGRVYPGV